MTSCVYSSELKQLMVALGIGDGVRLDGAEVD